MIVCICKAVSDKRIRHLVHEGVGTLREVSRQTGVGTCCGKCVPQAREVVSAALSERPGMIVKLADLMAAPALPMDAVA